MWRGLRMAVYWPQVRLDDCNPEDHGFSVYRGVIVVWDEDMDQRVLAVVDSLSDKDRMNLYAIREHEGSVSMWWRVKVPRKYRADLRPAGISVPNDNDWWSIYVSRQLTPQELPGMVGVPVCFATEEARWFVS